MADRSEPIKLLREATSLIRNCAGRKTSLIEPTNITDVVVAGDVHGNMPFLELLLEFCDLENHPGRHLVVQELIHSKQRYSGGGDPSHQAVDFIAELITLHPNRVHYLPGNHELAQWTGRSIIKDGYESCSAFNFGLEEAYGEDVEDAILAYNELFQSLPLAIRLPNRVFLCHTVPEGRHLRSFNTNVFDDPIDANHEYATNTTVYQLLWGRDVTEETTRSFLQLIDADIVINGHIACPSGFQVMHNCRLILDSSCPQPTIVRVPCDRPVTFAELEDELVVFEL